MFVGFVPFENTSRTWRGHHWQWRAANSNLCAALTAIMQWAWVLCVLHCRDTVHPINGLLQKHQAPGPWTQMSWLLIQASHFCKDYIVSKWDLNQKFYGPGAYAERLAMELSLPVLTNKWLWLWDFEHLAFCMRGERSSKLRHHRSNNKDTSIQRKTISTKHLQKILSYISGLPRSQVHIANFLLTTV